MRQGEVERPGVYGLIEHTSHADIEMAGGIHCRATNLIIGTPSWLELSMQILDLSLAEPPLRLQRGTIDEDQHRFQGWIDCSSIRCLWTRAGFEEPTSE